MEKTKTQTTYENKLSKWESVKHVLFEDFTNRMKTRSKTRVARGLNEGPEVIDVDYIYVPRLP